MSLETGYHFAVELFTTNILHRKQTNNKNHPYMHPQPRHVRNRRREKNDIKECLWSLLSIPRREVNDQPWQLKCLGGTIEGN